MSIDPKKTLTKKRKSKASDALSSNTSRISAPRKHQSDDSADALEIEPVREKVKAHKEVKKDNLAMKLTNVSQAKKIKRKTDRVNTLSYDPTIHNGEAAKQGVIEEVSTTRTDKKSKRVRQEQDLAEGGLPTKSKKRKRIEKDVDGLPDPDPETDTSLTDQAHKALAYAYKQFDSPSSWKFNKARQNWLIRNIFSDQIPDRYVSLLTRYLANVQGGVRENLIRTCQSTLLPAAAEPTVKDATSVIGPNQSKDEQAHPAATGIEMKQIRARAVLDAIGLGCDSASDGSR